MAKTFIYDVPLTGSAYRAFEVRDNFNALGINNATANPDHPKNARNGMSRVLSEDPNNVKFQIFWNGWQTLIYDIGGATQSRRKSKSFSALAQWTFDHGLGEIPITQVLVGNILVSPEKVEHPSGNRVIVTHATPQTGTIIVVG